MKQRPLGFLIFILVITLLAIIINIPKSFSLKFGTFTVPGLNKKITINKTISGSNIVLQKLPISRDLSFKKGLDLEGGTSVTLRADMKSIPKDQRDNALDSAKDVIERRINFFGVSEPVVQTSKGNNDYRIIVEIPGVTDVNEAVKLIGQTAKLTFWESGETVASNSAKIATPSASLPLGVTQFLGPDPKQTNLTGNDLQQTTVVFNSQTGKPEVQLSFTSEGSKKFAAITRRNTGKIVAIVLDNVVIEAPRVSEPILNGSAVINGDFTTETAKALQVQLNAGALPVSLSVLEQHAVGATLGQSSLIKSLLAGFIGFLVIIIFMISNYGRLGVIASFALLIYTLILLALFRLIPVTMTLAGIAGFILSIGIAVDANILIFERMKEEMRKGKSRDTALNLGFSRAWASIRDSNMASIITSGVLFYFGTGLIRGFALTLFIGVLVSMFSAITVTRTFLRVFYRG